jgi:hypothetical protein
MKRTPPPFGRTLSRRTLLPLSASALLLVNLIPARVFKPLGHDRINL